MGWGLLYLDRVLKFRILVVKHTEAQWFFRNNFYQHQVAALQNTQRKNALPSQCTCKHLLNFSYQYVSLVCVGFFSLLGNEQQLVKEKECSFIFGSLQAKCSFEDQLSITNEIRALPVGQQTLDFLKEAPNCIKMDRLLNKI